MRVALLTREYPPEVYGGAGVHVEYLSRALSELLTVAVHCFGSPRADPLVAGAYEAWEALDGHPALAVMSADLTMAAALHDVDVVHSHTWYANLAGHLAKLRLGVPHVVTTHSLEPLRPWKREQLGGGYELSSFCERTGLEHADAVIAVSAQMRRDILRCYEAIDPTRVVVIHNGIDAAEYTPDRDTEALGRRGIDPARPSVVFVGRITRQKGLLTLLEAADQIDESAQLVLCAGAPDTPELGDEVRAAVERLRERRRGVLWVEEMLPRQEIIQILSHATVFACPSVYEPFGLVNAEAMACEAPVVATAVGGIPEIVVDGETGYLVEGGDGVADRLAERINAVLADPTLAERFGKAGRRRVLEHFAWPTIAAQTADLYRRVLSR